MNKINALLGVNISDLRKKKGITQSQLGELCGVEYGTVQRWEKGTNWPKPNLIEIMLEVFNVELSELYKDKSKPKLTQNLPSIFKTLSNNHEMVALMSQIPEGDTILEDIRDMLEAHLEHLNNQSQGKEKA